MASELLAREEVRVEDTWNLADLYTDTAAWESDLELYNDYVNQLCEMEGQVGENAQNLLHALDLYMAAEECINRIYSYASRLYDQDTANSTYQTMQARAFQVYAEAAGRMAFVDPEILAIDEETLAAYYNDEPQLLKYKIYLTELFRQKEHRLSAEMEKVLAMTAEMAQTASDTFSVLDNADMVFPEVKDENGETVRLSHGRLIGLLESANREVRKETFEQYYVTYKQFLNTHASLYQGQVKQQIFYAKMRGYASTLEAAVDNNNVSPQVYRNLIEAVNEKIETLHRYVRLRKRMLGVDELHMYDIYTPIVGGISRKYTYEEAKEIVLRALEPMGEDYLAVVREAFGNRWIDVYENKGKRSGAYSSTAYGTHPYMLLNFSGSLDSVFTLIHEMGHSLHSYYSNKAQSFADSQYRIFVAEVASTVNEVLLLEYLLKENASCEDPERAKDERMYLLNHYLDMFKGTLYRQTQFAEYELATNEMAWNGEVLNAEALNTLYMELNKKYYGPDMISDEEIAYEWARIPHFYYNFYVYQYATSFAASVAIAHNILEDPAATVPGYLEFLSGGCTEKPTDLLRHVGVDLEKKQPITEALTVMDHVLEEMEKTLK